MMRNCSLRGSGLCFAAILVAVFTSTVHAEGFAFGLSFGQGNGNSFGFGVGHSRCDGTAFSGYYASRDVVVGAGTVYGGGQSSCGPVYYPDRGGGTWHPYSSKEEYEYHTGDYSYSNGTSYGGTWGPYGSKEGYEYRTGDYSYRDYPYYRSNSGGTRYSNGSQYYTRTGGTPRNDRNYYRGQGPQRVRYAPAGNRR